MTAGLLAASTAELTIRMVVALAVVAVLLMVLSRTMRRYVGGRAGRRPAIAIRHQQRLDKHASVTLLTAGERHLLVGTAGQSIVLLAEGDDLTAPAAEPVVGRAGRPGAGDGEGEGQPSLDVRGRRANPIKALQNRTVRRG